MKTEILAKLPPKFKVIDDKDKAVYADEITVTETQGNSLAITADKLLAELKWCFKASAKGDIRYYLNGVYVNDDYMVATDGHRLHKSNNSLFAYLDSDSGMILPTMLVKTLLKFWKKGSLVCFDYEVNAHDNHTFIAYVDNVKITGKTIQGNRYPDIDRVIPKDNTLPYDLRVSYQAVKTAKPIISQAVKADKIETDRTYKEGVTVIIEPTGMRLRQPVTDTQVECHTLINQDIWIYSPDCPNVKLNWNYLVDAVDTCKQLIDTRTDNIASKIKIKYNDRLAVIMALR